MSKRKRHEFIAQYGPSGWWRHLKTQETHHIFFCDGSWLDDPGEHDYMSPCGLYIKQRRIALAGDVVLRKQRRCKRCLNAVADQMSWIH